MGSRQLRGRSSHIPRFSKMLLNHLREPIMPPIGKHPLGLGGYSSDSSPRPTQWPWKRGLLEEHLAAIAMHTATFTGPEHSRSRWSSKTDMIRSGSLKDVGKLGESPRKINTPTMDPSWQELDHQKSFGGSQDRE